MSSKARIVVVEDKTSEREALARVLRMEDYEVETASGCDEANHYLEEPVDLVISDLRMGTKSGLDLLRHWKQHRPRVPFIMVTAYGEVDSAVEAMKLGAEEYLNKPVNPDELLVMVSKCLEARRKDGPFVTVNMAAVPENLVESELFGHVAGAFTGATTAREGRFEAANGGTIFIDEIGDFALTSQAKLLRVLENHNVTPIGSNDDKEVDVRVIAATSRNLEEMVEAGEFREDLYYRLNVVAIQLPSLRERRDDIPVLVKYFLAELSESTGKDDLRIDSQLMRFFQTYAWPGNVRQLRNCLESMVVLATGDKLTVDDLPSTIDEAPDTSAEVEIPAGTTLQELERTAVEQTLDEYHGNRTHAAEALGISVRTLQRKLKAWGIDDVGQEPQAD